MGGEEAGGQNIYVHQLGIHLVKKNFDVDVFTRFSDEKLPREAVSRDGGYRVVRIKAGPTSFIPKEQILNHLDEFTQGILDFITANKLEYDIIHTHYWLSGLAGLRLKEKLGLPVVHNFHSLGKVKHEAFGIHDEQALRREEGEKEIIENVDAVIATSPNEKRELAHFYKVPRKKIVVIPVGVDAARFSPVPKDEAKREVGIPVPSIALLFVGRFVEQKGLAVLIQAYALARREVLPHLRSKIRLYLIGGSPDSANLPEKEKKEMQHLKDLIRHNRLEQHITFLGNLPNRKTAPYYNAADICIVPSRYEPFGIVPLEAMACATPLVVSQVGGLDFTVQNLKTGFHARVGDVTDFAYKIRLLMENKNLRHELGNNGRRRVEELFTWGTITDEIIQVYHKFFTNHEA